jgi:hypothetical protein
MNNLQKAFNAAYADVWREIGKLEALTVSNNIDMESIDYGDVGTFGHAVDLLKQANEALEQYRINAE